MADVVIAQRDFYTQAPVASPAVFNKLARFENVTFLATSITLVEGSHDGSTYLTITSLGTTFTGGIIFKGVCFKYYRVTAGSSVVVMAN